MNIRWSSYLLPYKKKNGCVKTIKYLTFLMQEYYYDKLLNINTRGWIDFRKLGFDSNMCSSYEPTSYSGINRIMKSLRKKITKNSVLLDYGSGKGRLLVCAVKFQFKKIYGIELSESLCSIAYSNLHAVSKKIKTDHIHIINSDARNFCIASEVNFIFLFNPFTGDILKSVIHQIEISWRMSPRKIYIIYIYPDFVNNRFENCAWLTIEKELPKKHFNNCNCVIYRTKQEKR